MANNSLIYSNKFSNKRIIKMKIKQLKLMIKILIITPLNPKYKRIQIIKKINKILKIKM